LLRWADYLLRQPFLRLRFRLFFDLGFFFDFRFLYRRLCSGHGGWRRWRLGQQLYRCELFLRRRQRVTLREREKQEQQEMQQEREKEEERERVAWGRASKSGG
jgi:hypothetical protein